LCSFSSGTAEDAGSAKRSNVSGTFERGLDSSGSGGSTGTNDIAGLFDLTLDVGTEELRKGYASTTKDAANDPTAKATCGTCSGTG
jgi:hypothetical protein